jgi:hypothetical protein
MHGGELIEQLWVDQLQPGLKQLGPNSQRQHTADHQHRKGKKEVQRPDVLVIGRQHPATPSGGRMVIVIVRMVV